MMAYHYGQWIGAVLWGILFVWALHRLVFRRLIADETLAVVAAGVAAFLLACSLGTLGYANGRALSLSYVPFIKYAIGAFIGCLFRIWRDNGIEDRREK